MAGSGHKSGVQSEFLLCPARKLLVEILGGVGESGEDEKLTVIGIEWRTAFTLDHFAQSLEFGITGSANLSRSCKQSGKPITVFRKVLPPADTVHVL